MLYRDYPQPYGSGFFINVKWEFRDSWILPHLTMKVRTATCAGARAARVAAVAGEHKTFLPTSAVRCDSAASLHWDFFMGVSYLMLDIFRLLSLLLVLELR
jgi:hypothetical protein